VRASSAKECERAGVDLPVGEEGTEPGAQERAKAKQLEEVKEAGDVNVVEEPLDVKEEGADVFGTLTALSRVDDR
jgi:hypothetical protein